jgi:hypothetical protein
MTDHLLSPGQTLVLLGTGTSLRFAPFADPTCVCWGPAQMIGHVPRLDVAVTLHAKRHLVEQHVWESLRTATMPVFMQQIFDELPSSRRYPIEQVDAAFTVPGYARPFLTSTMAEIFALALLQDPAPAQISLFGVDLSTGSEYESQRSACAFFSGVCVGRGIPLYVHPASELLRTSWIYGLDEAQREAQLLSLRERELFFRLKRDRAIGDIQAAVTRLVQTDAILADVTHHVERAES